MIKSGICTIGGSYYSKVRASTARAFPTFGRTYMSDLQKLQLAKICTEYGAKTVFALGRAKQG